MEKKQTESNESFDKMSESLGSSFVGEEIEQDVSTEMNTSLTSINNLKKDIVSADLDTYTLEDAEYMEQQIKKSLDGLESVANRLEQEIKVGSKAGMYEVYATLSNSRMSAIKELREMRNIILNIKMKLREQQAPKNVTVNQTFMSSKDVDNLIKNAVRDNNMKKIKADFRIDKE
jgi:hypothetical protein